MDFGKSSAEELISELQSLQQKYNTVLNLYEEKLNENLHTKQSLLENEANIQAIIENSLDSIWSIDTDYNIQYINEIFSESFKHTFGVRLEKGMNILDALPEPLKPLWKERYDRAFKNEHFIFEDKVDIGDEAIYIEVAMNPVKINGKVTGASFFGKDITSRKRAEESLLKSEEAMKIAYENWNRTFQAMHSGIALLSNDQKIIQSNKAFQQFLNLTENDCTNKEILSLIPLLNSELVTSSNHTDDKGICKTEELQLDNRIFEIIVDPVTNNNGGNAGAVFIMNDVTLRKRDEKIQHILYEITGNPAYDKSLVELLVVVRNELSKVIDTTNFFVALHNKKSGKLRKVIFEDEKDDFFEWDAGKSLSGQVLKLGTALLLNASDEAKFAAENNIELLGSPAACWLGVPIMQGKKAIGVIVVQSYTNENAYDNATVRLIKLIAHELSIVIERRKMIEDLVAAKEKAEESDRLKSAFLANVSHEIRTPMNGILGFADLLKQPELTGEELHHFIGIIEKSGERMLNIINDLINISKIESGQMDINTTETNVNEQIEFLYSFFLPEATQKKLELKYNCPLPSDCSFITTDREKLYAILTNLIKNALKFTPAGSISFGYKLIDNQVLFYVKDTGIGIPLNKQKTIFERFVQANTDHKSRFEGAGLGLAISKAYVEMLGGTIWIKSEEGHGTSFYFTIPATCNSKSENNSADKIKSLYSESSNLLKTVLVADDDEISLLYIKRMLEEFNVQLIEAKNGNEAVEICEKHPEISLVLMDINMPELNGFEASKRIKQFRPELTMIAQTAYALEHDIENYKEPFDGYITKPIKTDEIKQLICNELSY